MVNSFVIALLVLLLINAVIGLFNAFWVLKNINQKYPAVAQAWKGGSIFNVNYQISFIKFIFVDSNGSLEFSKQFLMTIKALRWQLIAQIILIGLITLIISKGL